MRERERELIRKKGKKRKKRSGYPSHHWYNRSPQSINISEIQNFHLSHELPELFHAKIIGMKTACFPPINLMRSYRPSEQLVLVNNFFLKWPTHLIAIHLKYKIVAIPCPQVASSGVVHRSTCPCTNEGIAHFSASDIELKNSVQFLMHFDSR